MVLCFFCQFNGIIFLIKYIVQRKLCLYIFAKLLPRIALLKGWLIINIRCGVLGTYIISKKGTAGACYYFPNPELHGHSCSSFSLLNHCHLEHCSDCYCRQTEVPGKWVLDKQEFIGWYYIIYNFSSNCYSAVEPCWSQHSLMLNPK